MKHSGMARVALALIAGISIAWSTSTYGAEKVDTTRSLMALSAKAADEKARQDLLSILQPTGKFGRANRIRVDGIALNTIPYGAGFNGLCRMDKLVLIYGSTVKGPNHADAPLQPVGVDAQAMFHVIRGPVVDFADGFASQAAWSDDDCRKLKSDKKASWFSADDAREAARGVNVLLAAIEAVHAGRLKVDCDPKQFSGTCDDELVKTGRIDNLSNIKGGCPASEFQQCYKVMTIDEVELTIVASFEDDQSARPASIVSVSAVQYLVVT